MLSSCVSKEQVSLAKVTRLSPFSRESLLRLLTLVGHCCMYSLAREAMSGEVRESGKYFLLVITGLYWREHLYACV